MKLYDLKFKFKQICDFIIAQTFLPVGDSTINKYKDFSIKLTEKVFETRAGCYYPHTKTIEISSIKKIYFHTLMMILLHELAHHIDYCENNYSGHNTNFYKIYTSLIFTAIDCKVISYEEVLDIKSSTFIQSRNKLIKMVQKYVPQKNKPSIHTHCDMLFVEEYNNNLIPIKEIIKAKCSIPYNSFFKSRGYKWLDTEKVWYKTFYKLPDYYHETNFLTDNNFLCYSIKGYTCHINEVIFLITGNTYKYKDELKKLGYKYQNSEWSKKIPVNMHNKEINALRKFYGLRVSLKYI